MRSCPIRLLVLGLAALLALPDAAPAGDIPDGSMMAEAAARFLASLPPEKLKVATYPFDDPSGSTGITSPGHATVCRSRP